MRAGFEISTMLKGSISIPKHADMTLGSKIAAFLYKRTSRLDLCLPRCVNQILCPGVPGDVRLPGHRGCGQWVHPDIVVYEDRHYLAATAYPFGRDLYEEPEVFRSFDGTQWERIRSFSLSDSEARRYHLSDPDLFTRDGKIFLLYRRCRRSSCEGLDEVLLSEIPDGKPRIVLTGPKASLLSPAAFEREDGSTAVLFVDFVGFEIPRLVLSVLEPSGVLSSPSPVEYRGPDPWHVDVAWIDRVLYALLVAGTIENKNTKLLLLEGHSGGLRWDLVGEIKLSFSDIQAVYRSTFVSGKDGKVEIVASYRDSQRRWRLGREYVVLPRSEEPRKGDD